MRGAHVAARGTPMARLCSRLMSSVLFQVSPFDPSVLAGAMVVMTLIGAAAAYLPARRATSADPVATLRG